MTVSEYIFDFLQKKGSRQVFMVSGSSAMWLTDALKRNERLEPVCCQHEQAAAMAADGVGRLSQKIGVALVTIGPGATNAVTGVAGAYVDSSPMIVLSGQANSRLVAYEETTGIRQKGTQSILLGNMVKDITKYFAAVRSEKDIRYHMERACYEAMSGRKGPVWLDIPIDIQNKQVPEEEEMDGFCPEEEKKEQWSDKVQEVKERLRSSVKPLILAGNGILNANAKEELLRFCEKYQIPVVTSRGGIGVIPWEHPLFVGRPGSYGDRASHFAIQESDFLIVLGSRLSVSTVGYYPDHFGKNAWKVLVEIDEKEIGNRDVPMDVIIHGDCKEVLKEFLTEAAEGMDHSAWISRCRQWKDQYPTVLPEYKDEEGINSYVFTQKLSRLAPENAAVVVDTGSVCNIVSQSWELKKQQDYVISGGLSCMGFWASAIGAAKVREEVIALSGDGSVQMNIQDFATLQYYHLPVKLFVYNNKGYMLIRHNQHNYMNDRFLGVGPDSGVPSVSFFEVAKAYNIPAVQIKEKEEIEEKVRQVFEMEGPVVCEVFVQEFGMIAPRIASKVMPDGSLKAAEFDDLWPFLGE